MGGDEGLAVMLAGVAQARARHPDLLGSGEHTLPYPGRAGPRVGPPQRVVPVRSQTKLAGPLTATT